MEAFLEMLASEQGASLKTLEAYKSDLLKWTDYAQHLSLEMIGPSHHEEYMTYLKEKNLSLRSIARHLSSLRQFFYFLVTENILKKDPWQGLRSPRYSMTIPHILTPDEVKALLAYASQDASPEGLRLYALLEMLYATGMRISELISLPLVHMPEDPLPSLIIRGKGGHERYVFLTPHALKALEAYLPIRLIFACSVVSPYLFPSRGQQGYLTRQRVGQLMKGLASACGIDPERVSPHSIRHAFATHLLHRGVDLMTLKELLGHQDISTTQIYTHVYSERWVHLLSACHPLTHKKNI
jgi:integrase/recombinase XerD